MVFFIFCVGWVVFSFFSIFFNFFVCLHFRVRNYYCYRAVRILRRITTLPFFSGMIFCPAPTRKQRFSWCCRVEWCALQYCRQRSNGVVESESQGMPFLLCLAVFVISSLSTAVVRTVVVLLLLRLCTAFRTCTTPTLNSCCDSFDAPRVQCTLVLNTSPPCDRVPPAGTSSQSASCWTRTGRWRTTWACCARSTKCLQRSSIASCIGGFSAPCLSLLYSLYSCKRCFLARIFVQKVW